MRSEKNVYPLSHDLMLNNFLNASIKLLLFFFKEKI